MFYNLVKYFDPYKYKYIYVGKKRTNMKKNVFGYKNANTNTNTFALRKKGVETSKNSWTGICKYLYK